MSAGGIYNLYTNTGNSDKLLNATDLIRKRLQEYQINAEEYFIARQSLPDGEFDVKDYIMPSLNYIEKTHITFINQTYKPYIPIGSEYSHIRVNRPKLGDSIDFDLQKFGDFSNDPVLHIRLSGLSAVDNRDRVRYVAYLGHKLLENVKFQIQKNPLDEYGTDDYTMFYQFDLPINKRMGWLRNIGQEIPKVGFITADPTYDMQREYKLVGDGPQTLKQYHDTIDLFIPLLFWFRDIKSALPNYMIPWGQTTITVKLAEAEEIVGFADYGGGGAYNAPIVEFCDLYMNHIYTLPEIVNLFANKFSFSLVRVHKQHKETLTLSEGGVLLKNIKWPVETLYFGFRPRSNLTLSQYWHRFSVLNEKSYKAPVIAKNSSAILTGTITSASINEDGLAVAVLTGVGLSAIDNTYNDYNFNITAGPSYNSTDITKNRYTISTYDGTTFTIILTTGWVSSLPIGATFELYTPQLAINYVNYYDETPTVDSISMSSMGVDIYKNTCELFFNSYTPFRYGINLNTPEDRGLYMISFSMYPNEHQPYGSFNSSNSRETYIHYKSSYISQTTQADLIVIAKAINFLYVKNGTAMLRFIE